MELVDTPLCRMCEQEDESSIRECVFGESWPTPADIKDMSPSDLSTFLGEAGWTVT